LPIIRNDSPILEYDDSPVSVIMPSHEKLNIRLPEKAVFAFLRDSIENFAHEYHAQIVAEFGSMTKHYPIYVVNYKGEDICFCQAPVGAAPAAQILDWLIAYGVRKIISTGSCGTLVDLPENAFLIPTKALRDEGTSYHYLPPSRFVELNRPMIESIEQTLRRLNLPFAECITWSTDGFFRETHDMVAYRKAEGCSVVEMECSALSACAQMRGARFGQLLFTADSLANAEIYDNRDWGAASRDKSLLICMEIAHDM